MEEMPFRLYGESYMGSLRGNISEIVKQWVKEWVSINGESTLAGVNVSTDLNSIINDKEMNIRTLRYEKSEVYIFSSLIVLNELLAYITDIGLYESSISQSKISESIVHECLKDLCLKFINDDKVNSREHQIFKSEFNEEITKNPGHILIKISLRKGDINFILPALIVEKACPLPEERNRQKDKLQPIRNCKIEGTVALNLTVGSAVLDYGTVSNLSAGDVIRLDSEIDKPLSVKTKDNLYVCSAYLGKRNSKKAAKVVLNKSGEL